MGKIFNITACCNPTLHYMADISSRLAQIKEYIDRGEYFTINRARQYGKTTTLRALKDYIADEYYVISMDFQMQMSSAKFKNENTFSVAFAKAFIRIIQNLEICITKEMEKQVKNLEKALKENIEDLELVELFQYISDICKVSDKPLVLVIDEVDSAANNQVFLDFLAQLRGYYIDRGQSPALHSVILAGVYDIKNLKGKFRPGEEHKNNSPWNIAADFKVEMGFSENDISGMLQDYEKDHATGMDISNIAKLVYEYTSGYPFLVSKICKIIDEEIAGSKNFPELKAAWTYKGFLEAEKVLIGEKNTLFESMINKLYDFPELEQIVYLTLFTGKEIAYNPLDQEISMAEMFGFIKNINGTVAITNRIFEIVFYNFFLTSARNQNTDIYKAALHDKNSFINNGYLDMELLLERFIVHFNDLYGDQTDRFNEEDGRKYFLLYLKPIINGTGNYYIESRTRNMERTDVIIDYNGEQIIIELKIWRGNSYNQRGEEQLANYLEHYHLKKGYMLSYNFNKNKQTGIKHILIGDKILVEATV